MYKALAIKVVSISICMVCRMNGYYFLYDFDAQQKYHNYVLYTQLL